jgi:multidrug transporter EmrE-like cation transporter
VTQLQLALVLLAQTSQVAGQLFLKQGMLRPEGRVPRVVLGTAMLTFWFLAWIKLLQGLDISFLYPFEGISLVGLVLASRFLLKERTQRGTWIGAALISVGLILVGMNQ